MKRQRQYPSGKTRKSPFSLVELLVVTAIIAMLTAMLLPALQKAKGMAFRATCLSDLRQVYVGAAAYASDYNGYAPFYKIPGWTTAAAAVTTINPFSLSYGNQTAAQFYPRAKQMVDPGYWPANILRCPARPNWYCYPSSGNWFCFDTKTYYAKIPIYNNGVACFLLSSYPIKTCAVSRWNGAQVNDPNANLSYRLGQNPGETFAVDAFYLYSYGIWHQGLVPVVREDGAAEAVPKPTITNTSSADVFMELVRDTSR